MFRILVVIFAMSILPSQLNGQNDLEWIFVSSGKAKAIHRCLLNTETGEMTDVQAVVEDIAPQFVITHPTLDVIYVGAKAGGSDNADVRSFRVSKETGELVSLGSATTLDNGSTHLAITSDGRTLLSCAYGGDGTSALEVLSNGDVRPAVSKIDHSGSSVHEKRQKRHHPHGIAIHPNDEFACVADLGNDHIEIFAIDNSSCTIKKHSRWKAADGAGPRHVSFHPSGDVLYSINELNSTIDVLAFDATEGTVSHLQTVTTLPDDFSGENKTAEIVVHPSGKFLYGSNRGHDSTAVFTIDEETGQLSLLEIEPTQGEHPRFVGLNRTGKIYLATNMHSNSMVSFFVDEETGALTPTGHSIEVDSPRGAAFVAKE